MPTLPLKNFNGGLQEDSVGAPDSQVKRFQNLRLNSAGNVMSMYGRRLDSTTADLYKVSADSNNYQRINTLIPYKIDGTYELLKHVGNKLVWADGSTYSEIKSPVKKETGCAAYSGTTTIFVSGNNVKGISVYGYVADFTSDDFSAFSGIIGGSGYVTVEGTNVRAGSIPTFTSTSGSPTITVSSATNLTKGMRLTDYNSNPAIPEDTYITNISGTTLTLNQNASASVVGRPGYWSSDILVTTAHASTSTNLTIYSWGESFRRSRNEATVPVAVGPVMGQKSDVFSYLPILPSFRTFYSSDEHDTISKTIFDNHLYVTDKTLKTNPMVVFRNSNDISNLGTEQVSAIAAGIPKPLSGKITGFLTGYENQPESINSTGRWAFTNTSTTINLYKTQTTLLNSTTQPVIGDYVFPRSDSGASPVPAGTAIDDVSDAGAYWVITLSAAATASQTVTTDTVQRDVAYNPLVPSGGTAGSATGYSWAIVYSYTYQSNGKTYKQYGRPLYLLASNFHATYYPNYGCEGLYAVYLDNTLVCPSNGFKRTSDPDSENSANRQLVGVDADNIKIEVYRTAAAGNVFYLYGEHDNKPDINANSTIYIINKWSTKNRTIYTTSGVAENYRPPVCKYITASGPYMIYAHGHEINESDRGGDLLKNRFWQSKPGLPYAVPADFYGEVDEEIVGLSTVKTVPVIFTENYVYRVEGSFDSFGRGSLEAKRITEITGCVSDQSIVQTEDGVYFAGNDGFYFTDGFTLTNLSKNMTDTYRDVISSSARKALISGSIDILNREVHWSVKVDDVEGGTNECNASFVFDIESGSILGPHTSGFDDHNASNDDEEIQATCTTFNTTSGSRDATVATANVVGILEKGQVVISSRVPFGTFIAEDPVVNGLNYEITLSNAAYTTGTSTARTLDPSSGTWMFFEQFQPTCYAYMDQTLYVGDVRGYTFKYDRTYGSCDVVDVGNTTATTWEVNPVKYHFATIDSALGAAALKKWVSRATIKMRFSSDIRSNISVQPLTEREANNLLMPTVVLEDTNNTPWGYSGINWGSPLLFSTASDVKDYQVHMPRDAGLRSTYRAMHLTNGDVVIQESGSMATQATVSTPTAVTQLKRLTVVSATNWYGDIIGYYVKFFEIDANGAVSYLFSGKKFWVTQRESDTQILVVDLDNDLVAATAYDFELRGMRKDDVLELQEIDYHFELLGRGQEKGGQSSSSSGA